PLVADYSLSSSAKDLSRLDELLSNEQIYGVNLQTAGLPDKVKQYFAELTDRPGAVRATLEKYTAW
ncbi:MAG: mannitol dehydrogenase family protein, partial [Acetatifactor sp.]|nr:mannitol dehydrogenase family protein [Acetatifactor sp.]